METAKNPHLFFSIFLILFFLIILLALYLSPSSDASSSYAFTCSSSLFSGSSSSSFSFSSSCTSPVILSDVNQVWEVEVGGVVAPLSSTAEVIDVFRFLSSVALCLSSVFNSISADIDIDSTCAVASSRLIFNMADLRRGESGSCEQALRENV